MVCSGTFYAKFIFYLKTQHEPQNNRKLLLFCLYERVVRYLLTKLLDPRVIWSVAQ